MVLVYFMRPMRHESREFLIIFILAALLVLAIHLFIPRLSFCQVDTAYARMYLANPQSLPANVYTKILVDTASFDSQGITDAVNHRIIPRTAGYYLVTGEVIGMCAAASNMNVGISVNGVSSGLGSSGSSSYSNPVTSNVLGGTVTDLVYFNGNSDYVELFAAPTSIVSLVIVGTVNNYLSVTGPILGIAGGGGGTGIKIPQLPTSMSPLGTGYLLYDDGTTTYKLQITNFLNNLMGNLWPAQTSHKFFRAPVSGTGSPVFDYIYPADFPFYSSGSIVINPVTGTVGLVNDLVAPGDDMLYGTGSTGIKGWYPQPAYGNGVRQTVRFGYELSNPTYTAPVSGMVTAGTGLAATLYTAGGITPAVLSFANGGSDFLETVNTDQANAWQGLQQNTTNYLYIDRNGLGSLAYGSTPVKPEYSTVFPSYKSSLLHFEGSASATMVSPTGDDYGNSTWIGTATSPTYDCTATHQKYGSCSARLSGAASAYNIRNAAMTFASNSWTAEAWFAFNSLPAGTAEWNLMKWGNIPAADSFGMSLKIKAAAGLVKLYLGLSSNGTSNNVANFLAGQNTTWSSGSSPPVFYHIAVVFTGSEYYVFLNGVIDIVVSNATCTGAGAPAACCAAAGTGTCNVNIARPSNGFYIGFTSNTWDGWIDDFRFTPGALYTYNFTPYPVTLTGRASWFNIFNYQMFTGSPENCTTGACGFAWGPVTRLFVGEAITTGTCTVTPGTCTAAAGSVSTPVTYAYNRTWDSGWFNVLTAKYYQKFHNLGIPDSLIDYKVSTYLTCPDQSRQMPANPDPTAAYGFVFINPVNAICTGLSAPFSCCTGAVAGTCQPPSRNQVSILTLTNPLMDETNTLSQCSAAADGCMYSISAHGRF